jgi:hypothetical protein
LNIPAALRVLIPEHDSPAAYGKRTSRSRYARPEEEERAPLSYRSERIGLPPIFREILEPAGGQFGLSSARNAEFSCVPDKVWIARVGHSAWAF